MAQERVTVTALRAHRSGWAGGAVAEGGEYAVPAAAVPSLVRQGLVADPAAKAAPKGKSRAAAVAGDGEDAAE